jgi:hypothetical protein
MMGVEKPAPAILVFHLIFSWSFHFKGGCAPSATPVPELPRHEGQVDSPDAPLRMGPRKPRQRVETRGRRDSEIMAGWG